MKSDHLSIYQKAILEALPRVLSMLDREVCSKSYGCADRVFWSWKFVDFPGARFQEIALVLAQLTLNPALLLEHDLQKNILLQWTKASISFWTKLQHKDGSFDEAYPYERSLAATAFTGFYVGQAFLKIRETYSKAEQKTLIQTFNKLGDWLINNDEHHGILSNHLAAAAAALDVVADITNDAKYLTRRDYFIRRIFKHQSKEGWYEEYGGADPGYQTHTIFYLGYILLHTHDSNLLQSLTESIRYLWHFIHVDGSFGGEYGSRNTRFLMPAGFEMLAHVIPEAASIAHFMRESIRKQKVVSLHAMDTYNIFPLINNYFFAIAHAKPVDIKALPQLPFHINQQTRFEESGHLILSTSGYQAIISTSKGGVIRAFSKNATNIAPWSDSGLVIELAKGKKISSQGLKCSKINHINHHHVEIESRFTSLNQTLMSPTKFLAFRGINLISVYFPSFAYSLKNLLVNVLVKRKKFYPVRLIRKISWHEDKISIQDDIILDKLKKINKIYTAGQFSTIHMGSSRYFEWQELAQQTMTTAISEDLVNQLNETRKLTLSKEWSLK